MLTVSMSPTLLAIEFQTCVIGTSAIGAAVFSMEEQWGRDLHRLLPGVPSRVSSDRDLV